MVSGANDIIHLFCSLVHRILALKPKLFDHQQCISPKKADNKNL